MNLQLIIILMLAGILQGVLEWLPVSSEAFVFLFLIFCGVDPHLAIILAMMYHLPTGLASILFYRREYRKIILDVLELRFSIITRFVILSSIFTCVTAVPIFLIMDYVLAGIEEFVEKVAIVILIAIGVVMCITGFAVGSRHTAGMRSLEEATARDCIIVGFIQGFSIIPGVSRSAVTITALLYEGFDKKSSLDGSFILAGVASTGVFIFIIATGRLSIQYVLSVPIIMSMSFAFLISLITMRTLLYIAGRMNYGMFLRFVGILMIIFGVPLFLI